MPYNLLARQLFLPLLLILLASFGVAGWFTTSSLRDFYYSQTQSDLEARAYLLAPQVVGLLVKPDSATTQSTCKQLGERSKTHMTLVSPDGRVVCDSWADPARMDNHSDREEIRDALSGKTGAAVRFDRALETDMIFIAVPVHQENRTIGAVRTALSLESMQKQMDQLARRITLTGVVLAILAMGAGLYFSRRVSQMTETIQCGVERFAQGDFSYRIPQTGSRGFVGLSKTLNDMARKLDERIRTLTEQRNEQEALLSSMVEGVFAVDPREQVIHLNQAAALQFGVSPESAQGRTLQEVVRNVQLQEFVKNALASRDLKESDIEMATESSVRYLQVRGTVLRNAGGKSIGAVFVLNDVTRLRKLETMRRDFVANVSHELKTPITSIKGFVETLLDGALESKEDTHRFLGIVSKQAERLNAIIEDLLSLSRIEQDSEHNEIVTQDCKLKEVMENVIGDCSQKAGQKNITLSLTCDDRLRARVNPPLLEEAVVNLVDNAIKYSDPSLQVSVVASHENGGVLIRVIDQGRGIDRQHLPRLFERFYRVDKARSRQMGGTGLGLAIVKHIAQAHGGRVDVQSTPGKGSEFSIYLPDN